MFFFKAFNFAQKKEIMNEIEERRRQMLALVDEWQSLGSSGTTILM